MGLVLEGALFLIVIFPALLAGRQYFIGRIQTLPPTEDDIERAVRLLTRAAFGLMLIANIAGLIGLLFFAAVGDIRCLILGVTGSLILHLQAYPARNWLPERLLGRIDRD